MLANVNESTPSVIGSLAFGSVVFAIQETPFLDSAPVVGAGKQPAATKSRRRWRIFSLPVQSFKKIIKQPAWNGVALARIDPAKREQMTEQYLPMQVHIRDQAPPIDLVALPENQVGDIG